MATICSMVKPSQSSLYRHALSTSTRRQHVWLNLSTKTQSPPTNSSFTVGANVPNSCRAHGMYNKPTADKVKACRDTTVSRRPARSDQHTTTLAPRHAHSASASSCPKSGPATAVARLSSFACRRDGTPGS